MTILFITRLMASSTLFPLINAVAEPGSAADAFGAFSAFGFGVVVVVVEEAAGAIVVDAEFVARRFLTVVVVLEAAIDEAIAFDSDAAGAEVAIVVEVVVGKTTRATMEKFSAVELVIPPNELPAPSWKAPLAIRM